MAFHFSTSPQGRVDCRSSMSSEDEFGAVGYLAPQSPNGHKALARHFSVNDSGVVDLHGSRNSSRVGLAIPNSCYDDWDDSSDPRTPTSTHAFFQRTNSHPPLASPTWTNHPTVLLQAPDRYMKVPDYEELPNPVRHPDDPGVYTSIDEGSVIVAAAKKSPDAVTHPIGKQAQINFTCTGQNARLRTNPLYEQSGGAGSFALPPYPPLKKGLCTEGSCCLQTFGFLFAMIALVVVLWILLVRHSGGPEYHELVKDIEYLRSNLSKLNSEQRDHSVSISRINDLYQIVQLLHNSSEMLETLSDLEDKVMTIRMDVNLQEATIQNLTNKIAKQTDQITFLKSQESHANESFENLKLSIGEKDQQLKMRGLANMSGCVHLRRSLSRQASFDNTTTENLDLSHFLVLGVLCTTVGGTEALLEDSAARTHVYRCICRGRREGESNRVCIIHYWTCPLLP